jgi:RNA 2',3'-cyclic 3'-phosphodiesterase
MNPGKRLFFALWPDENTRQQCLNVSKAIGEYQGRAVAASNLHVTLVFLGNIADDKSIALQQSAANIRAPEISLQFNQLSFWKKPGVLCLTAAGSCPELIKLAGHLSVLARKLGIYIDERPYQPHVTLVKKAKEPVMLKFAPIIWRSDTFCLVESCSLPSGVQYKVVKYWGKM